MVEGWFVFAQGFGFMLLHGCSIVEMVGFVGFLCLVLGLHLKLACLGVSVH